MVVPFVEVSHLPSSTSFFSAILQPLGLGYINAARDDPPSSVTFGASGNPILQIRQASPPRLSSLVLTAPSRSAVVRFHNCGLRSNPPLLPRSQGQGQQGLGKDGGENDVVRAALLDLDGNSMEVVYPDPRRPQDAVQYSGSPVRRTQATTDEVGRILEWNYDVASAAPRAAASTTSARPSSAATPSPSPSPAVPRSRHADDSTQPPMSASPRQSASSNSNPNSGGINASTVVGALLGVAAGAALTYGIVSRDKGRAPRHDVDVQVPRTLPRRATFPERPAPEDSRSRYQQDHYDKKTAVLDSVPRRVAFSYPDKNSLSTYDHDYSYDRSRRHDHDDWQPQRYLTQGVDHSIASQGAATKSAARSSAARGRAVDGSYDVRSRHSSRVPSVRSRSEAPLQRAPLSVAGLDERSHARAPSRYSGAPKSSYTTGSRPVRPAYEPEPSTYVSARTHRTSTALGPSQPLPDHELPYRTQISGSSRVPAARTPSCVSARQIPLPASQAPSYVSARDMPLPASGVGSSHANWDDDLDSVVPGDSISCVGSRAGSSRRSRTHRY
ncbi:hypothetical protein TOPH_02160 [Tolypocladium ophioglossoides CBS 100239]|uniref:Uncharacterized protein n=1 Tax=Tolypocladium ophioglossoides (strain CBS 100239) TaxID=1163406 RepID=A0A0L0NHT0_TOLOC|nr:hypothetical protein TOPH_02160 [Tolypocladium ophioglossoides CBS 100239]